MLAVFNSNLFASGLHGALKYPENRLIGAINFLAFSILKNQMQNGITYLDQHVFPKEKNLKYVEQPTKDAILLTRNIMLVAAEILCLISCPKLVQLCCNSPSVKPFSVGLWDHLGISVLTYMIKIAFENMKSGPDGLM